MNRADRGLKHHCPKCAIKYYDLGRKTITCPQCGAKPAEAKLSRSSYVAKKSSPTRFKKTA
jgi:hypothetical protein